MTDQNLLMFGVGVTFIFIAGVYVYVRAAMERHQEEPPRRLEQPRAEPRGVTSPT